MFADCEVMIVLPNPELRAIVFANGTFSTPQSALALVQPQDLIIAADGGARHCAALGITPDVAIGDFDSLNAAELDALQARGVQIMRYPERKDYTDLELALQHAVALGASEIIVLGALGARWDQTLANLLLPGAAGFEHVRIRLVDGAQEIMLARPGIPLVLTGRPGDTISLIPLSDDALGVQTTGLEYALDAETLYFGATRGVSNVLVNSTATISMQEGLLLCVIIHA